MEHQSISRVTRTKAEAKATYDRLSRWYDVLAGSSERKYRDLGLQKLRARAEERILEIGFGTGHAMLSLAKAVGPEGKVHGIDISEGMRAVTHRRIEDAGLSDRVELRCGDALSLPFDPESFDAIYMSFTLELFDTPEIPLLLRRCREVLRPCGRLVVVSLVRGPGTAVRIYEWFHKKMPRVVDCRPIQAQSAISAAGFQIRDVSARTMWGLPVEIILAELTA